MIRVCRAALLSQRVTEILQFCKTKAPAIDGKFQLREYLERKTVYTTVEGSGSDALIALRKREQGVRRQG